MKSLNINLKFTIPENNFHLNDTIELVDFIIDQIWDTLYEMKYIRNGYEIIVDNKVEYKEK